MEKLVVVIPNYNGEQYVKNCMNSLIPEGFPILIIDNASTDHSAEYMKEYAAQYPEQVQMISMTENTGFCKAVNTGIQRCDAEYVILLNNDTVVQPGFCNALLQRIEKDKRIFSVSAQMRNLYHPELLDDAGDLYCALGWAFSPAKDKPAVLFNKPCNVFAACGGAAIYRVNVFQRIGFFDENHFAYLEDIDIGYRAKLCGYRNVYEPSAKVLHAGSGVSGSRHNDFKVSLSSRNSVYLIYKNMFLLQKVINLPLLVPGYLVKTVYFAKKGMGITYITGVINGLKLCFSKEGRKHKVRWTPEKIKYACGIQLELWLNVLRRFIA